MMRRRRIQLEDGRYLIFFWFDNAVATSGEVTEKRKSKSKKED